MHSNLGFGIGLRPKHFPVLIAQTDLSIDWLEIVSENYMGVGGRARHVLAELRARYPIATHGVGLSIAGFDPLDKHYLRQLRELTSWLEPTMVTDHLCWTSHRGHHSYDLLPFPLTEESLQHIVARVHTVQEFLGRTILLENPSSYIDFSASSYSEPEFLAELCKRSACGILLDLNNCVVNSRNLNWDPAEYLEKLRPETVAQFHLAGHSFEEFISIDTHDHCVPETVWRVFEDAVQRFPQASVLLEWDDKIPEMETMLDEIATARRRATKPEAWTTSDRPLSQISRPLETAMTPAACKITARINEPSLSQVQSRFYASIMNPESGTDFEEALRDSPAGAQRGLYVYQSAYPLRFIEVLKNTFPSLHFILEDELFAVVAQDYAKTFPNVHFSVNYIGARLPAFLRDVALPYNFGVDQSLICAIATFDWTHYELLIREDDASLPILPADLALWTSQQWETHRLGLRKECTLLHLEWPVFDVWAEIHAERVPPPPQEGPELCLFKRDEGHVRIQVLKLEDEGLWRALERGASLSDCIDACGLLGSDAEKLEYGLQFLVDASRAKLLCMGQQ